jgi:hypothetical protein
VVALNTNLTSTTGTNVSSLAEALNLLSASRLLVANQFNLADLEDSELRELLVTATLDQLVYLQLIDQEQREIVINNFHISVDTVVVTAVSTGVAIWVMYVGQAIAALISTSAAWVQIDPLVVMQGDNSEDKDTELSAEERLFDDSASKSK